MKRYNAIKNLILSSAVATMYWGWVVDGTPLHTKIIATLVMFVLMLLLLRDADNRALKDLTIEYLKKQEQKNNER